MCWVYWGVVRANFWKVFASVSVVVFAFNKNVNDASFFHISNIVVFVCYLIGKNVCCVCVQYVACKVTSIFLFRFSVMYLPTLGLSVRTFFLPLLAEFVSNESHFDQCRYWCHVNLISVDSAGFLSVDRLIANYFTMAGDPADCD